MDSCIFLMLSDILVKDVAKYIFYLYLQNIQFQIKIKYDNYWNKRDLNKFCLQSSYDELISNTFVAIYICHINEIDIILRNKKSKIRFITIHCFIGQSVEDQCRENQSIEKQRKEDQSIEEVFPYYMLKNIIKKNIIKNKKYKYDRIINPTNITIKHYKYDVFPMFWKSNILKLCDDDIRLTYDPMYIYYRSYST